MQKIVPCLWFDGHGEEALNFYAGIVPARAWSTCCTGATPTPG